MKKTTRPKKPVRHYAVVVPRLHGERHYALSAPVRERRRVNRDEFTTQKLDGKSIFTSRSNALDAAADWRPHGRVHSVLFDEEGTPRVGPEVWPHFDIVGAIGRLA